MDFKQSIEYCFKHYADFAGRAQRTEFWLFFLFCFLVSMALGFVSAMISIVFSLATLVPTLAVGARRLHDTNRTGWWQLIALVPILGIIVLIVFFATKGDVANNQYGG